MNEIIARLAPTQTDVQIRDYLRGSGITARPISTTELRNALRANNLLVVKMGSITGRLATTYTTAPAASKVLLEELYDRLYGTNQTAFINTHLEGADAVWFKALMTAPAATGTVFTVGEQAAAYAMGGGELYPALATAEVTAVRNQYNEELRRLGLIQLLERAKLAGSAVVDTGGTQAAVRTAMLAEYDKGP
jgi:hypothetical protein